MSGDFSKKASSLSFSIYDIGITNDYRHLSFLISKASLLGYSLFILFISSLFSSYYTGHSFPNPPELRSHLFSAPKHQRPRTSYLKPKDTYFHFSVDIGAKLNSSHLKLYISVDRANLKSSQSSYLYMYEVHIIPSQRGYFYKDRNGAELKPVQARFFTRVQAKAWLLPCSLVSIHVENSCGRHDKCKSSYRLLNR